MSLKKAKVVPSCFAEYKTRTDKNMNTRVSLNMTRVVVVVVVFSFFFFPCERTTVFGHYAQAKVV